MRKPISKVAPVHVSGPLAPFAAGFKFALRELGYTQLSAVNQMRLMGDLSRWLEHRQLSGSDLTRTANHGVLGFSAYRWTFALHPSRSGTVARSPRRAAG